MSPASSTRWVPSVSGWKVGDAVLGFARQSGSYAEYAVVPVSVLARKPSALTFEQAAGVPIAGETAYRALHEAGNIKAGQKVLIHGAAGGVGSAAVQIAKAAGAQVIGTASSNNREFLQSIGVDYFFDYRAQKFEDAFNNVDLVLNTANAETNARSIGIVRKGGTLVSVVGPPDAAACAAAKIRCVRPDRSTGASSADLLGARGRPGRRRQVQGVRRRPSTRWRTRPRPGKRAARGIRAANSSSTCRGPTMMRAAFGALLLSLAAGSVAEDARVAGSVFENAALRLGVDRIQSLQFDASGSYYQFGQAPAPELPWPEFKVDGYVATLDFARAAIHAKYHRVQVQEPGRARPYSEQTMDQFARDGMTWNLTPGPTAIPANLAERNAELWASPQGFIKAAIAHHAKVKRFEDGRALVELFDRKVSLRRRAQ